MFDILSVMTKSLTTNQIKLFRRKVLAHYRTQARALPWRKTENPYFVLVSEIMLQQTQADRVVPKYKQFIGEFPTVRSLAAAPFSKVLRIWQGLGYNRRAKYLRGAAAVLATEYSGQLPKTESELTRLPGVGPYTAAAVCAFAYNQPSIFIETNIRQVFLFHFFGNKRNITDREILPLTAQTLDTKNPRVWYWALMDYGSYLKKTTGNINSRSKHYVKQTAFQGSHRQVRGGILKVLLETSMCGLSELSAILSVSTARLRLALGELEKEGMVRKYGQKYRLA